MKANGLARADFGGRGKSDPFVEALMLGEQVHKTKTINDNLDPEWEEEKFVVEVLPDGSGGEELTLSVWDSDGPFLKGDFLGQVVLKAKHLLSPPEETQTMDLTPKKVRDA